VQLPFGNFVFLSEKKSDDKLLNNPVPNRWGGRFADLYQVKKKSHNNDKNYY